MTSATGRSDPVSGLNVRGWAVGLARAGAAPLACGVVLIVLLATYVIGGGGGTISRVGISVSRAAVVMQSSASHGAAGRTAPVYLTLHNLSGNVAVLLSASSPDAARVELTGGSPRRPLARLAVGPGATVSLSPSGPDLTLVRPKPVAAGQDVVLVLHFRHAGAVTVDAAVTPRGTP